MTPSKGTDGGAAGDAAGGGALESLEWPALHPASRQLSNAATAASVCHGLPFEARLIRTRSKVVSTGSRSPQLEQWAR